MLGAELYRQGLGGLADDFEISYHSVLDQGTIHEGSLPTLGVLLDAPGCVADVAEVDGIPLHSGRASRSTSSRM